MSDIIPDTPNTSINNNPQYGSIYLIINEYGNAVAASSTLAKAEQMQSILANRNKSSYGIQTLNVDYLKFPGQKAIVFADNRAFCPLCGGVIKEMSKAYSCVNWKKGCHFSLWKERYGSTFTMDDAITLLNGKNVYKNNIDKEGNAFPVSWALDENHEMRFKRIEE